MMEIFFVWVILAVFLYSVPALLAWKVAELEHEVIGGFDGWKIEHAVKQVRNRGRWLNMSAAKLREANWLFRYRQEGGQEIDKHWTVDRLNAHFGKPPIRGKGVPIFYISEEA